MEVGWYGSRCKDSYVELDWKVSERVNETPAKAFVRKMPPRGTTVTDEQSGEVYDVR